MPAAAVVIFTLNRSTYKDSPIPNGTESRLTGRRAAEAGRRRSRRKSLAPVRTDLAERLRPLQSALRRTLARADVLAEMIRAVNASLEPERVAEALVGSVSVWVPASGWLVLASDDGGRTRTMAAKGLTAAMDRSTLGPSLPRASV